MDVEDIRDEVDEFNESYFVEYLDLIDDNFDFIEENELILPKKNYLYLLKVPVCCVQQKKYY